LAPPTFFHFFTGSSLTWLESKIYFLKTTLIKEYLLSNQVIEEPVKKWQNVGGANTLVKISFYK